MSPKKSLDNADCKGEDTGHYGQKKLVKLRAEVNRLYFNDGRSKNAIVSKKRVSKQFVVNWTQSPDQDFTADKRGWPVGRRRKWDDKVEERIKGLHASLKTDSKTFYWGPTAIAQEWRSRHPDEVVPPLRTIGQILKDLGLAQNQRKRGAPGASRYLCYPEHTIYSVLGGRVMEADFVGHKFLAGGSEPLHFVGFCFKKSPKLRYYKRIASANAGHLIAVSRDVFQRFEKPDCLKVDNAAATIGSRSGKRTISRTVAFLLGQEVHPIFAVPRRPFSQASIEGNNSVFGRKFWNRCKFESLADVDEQLEWFNESSLRYTGYQPPTKQTGDKDKTFVPVVYFLRQVREQPDTGDASIEVLNEHIRLPASYVNYFVLAKWHLLDETLTVYLEKEQQLHEVVSERFAINPTSRKKYEKGGLLSFCI